MWTNLFYRHWDDWRAGKRQHLFSVSLADGKAKDLTTLDRDVPTIATGGDGDVSVAPDGREIAVAIHGDRVADSTNVDIHAMRPDGSGLHALTSGPGADNTPRYSPDGSWLAYLSLERAGFEADRSRLMLVPRADGRSGGQAVGVIRCLLTIRPPDRLTASSPARPAACPPDRPPSPAPRATSSGVLPRSPAVVRAGSGTVSQAEAHPRADGRAPR
jgi:dipeptidyl aminopeptidase/acylaminoacyl peptidase